MNENLNIIKYKKNIIGVIMCSESSNQKRGGISIGGNVNTAGGSIVGGDMNNISVKTESSVDNSYNNFSPIYTAIEQINLANDEKEKLTEIIQVLQGETSKKQLDEKKIESLLQKIFKMSPDILDVIVATISNPLAGLSTMAHKISKKAKELDTE